MLYFFNDEMIKKMLPLIPSVKEHQEKVSYLHCIARKLLREVDLEKVKVEDGFLIVCSDN